MDVSEYFWKTNFESPTVFLFRLFSTVLKFVYHCNYRNIWIILIQFTWNGTYISFSFQLYVYNIWLVFIWRKNWAFLNKKIFFAVSKTNSQQNYQIHNTQFACSTTTTNDRELDCINRDNIRETKISLHLNFSSDLHVGSMNKNKNLKSASRDTNTPFNDPNKIKIKTPPPPTTTKIETIHTNLFVFYSLNTHLKKKNKNRPIQFFDIRSGISCKFWWKLVSDFVSVVILFSYLFSNSTNNWNYKDNRTYIFCQWKFLCLSMEFECTPTKWIIPNQFIVSVVNGTWLDSISTVNKIEQQQQQQKTRQNNKGFSHLQIDDSNRTYDTLQHRKNLLKL